MNKVPIAIFLIMLIASCTNSEEDRKDGFTHTLTTKEDSLFRSVMQAHDTGMAKMSKLIKYQKLLDQSLDSINRLPDRERAAALPFKDFLTDLQKQLQQAQAGMNLWMEEFKADSATEDKEKRIEYLGSEKTKVEKVREDIVNSLRKADSLFNK